MVKNDSGIIPFDADTKNLFEDIFSFDEMPTDTVRLSASTVKELFKDTDFTEFVKKQYSIGFQSQVSMDEIVE